MHRFRIWLQLLLSGFAVLSGILALSGFAQAAGDSAPAGGGDEIIRFLNQTVIWYRQLTAQQQLVSEPSDVLFLSDNRRNADQVAKLAFNFARVRAQSMGDQSSTATTNGAASGSTQYQRLAELTGKADQQVKQSEQELAATRQKLAAASGKKRKTLEASAAETESELELFKARSDTLHSMLQVATSSTNGKLSAGSLSVQIEELARTVPAAADTSKEPGNSSASSNSSASAVTPPPAQKSAETGVFALIGNLFAQRRKIEALDENLRQTDALADSAKTLRAPLVAKLRELTQKSDQLAAQPASTDAATLVQQKKDVDSLTAEYKQLSASVAPLAKMNILLDLYKRSVENWRNAVNSQYIAQLKGLLVRLAGLGVILGLVLGISELWRRATFRYITDPRRRRQFMFIRRIIVWSLIAIILTISFASELGAITTFAGLLTAGIVVALQNVILAVAGYFFLIGKYGVRVGDRVQVAGITGDVVDIGMVRLHLMEVTGGTSPRPTGRVVVFSNSIVFQAGAGLFKPIPGTSFLWHEITLTLSPESDYRHVEQRLLDAVNHVCSEYRDRMEMQRRNMERSLRSVQQMPLTPESRLRLTPSGLEVVIRYPVELGNAAEIDDRITRELLEAIGHEPGLRLLGAQIEAKPA